MPPENLSTDVDISCLPLQLGDGHTEKSFVNSVTSAKQEEVGVSTIEQGAEHPLAISEHWGGAFIVGTPPAPSEEVAKWLP